MRVDRVAEIAVSLLSVLLFFTFVMTMIVLAAVFGLQFCWRGEFNA